MATILGAPRTAMNTTTFARIFGDITEREDWGPVWAIQVKWLLQSGGIDEANHKAAFYDLLLKSWGEQTRVHIGGTLAVVPEPKTDAADQALKSKLFYPGRGALGGFSYLFMDKETKERHQAGLLQFPEARKRLARRRTFRFPSHRLVDTAGPMATALPASPSSHPFTTAQNSSAKPSSPCSRRCFRLGICYRGQWFDRQHSRSRARIHGSRFTHQAHRK